MLEIIAREIEKLEIIIEISTSISQNKIDKPAGNAVIHKFYVYWSILEVYNGELVTYNFHESPWALFYMLFDSMFSRDIFDVFG